MASSRWNRLEWRVILPTLLGFVLFSATFFSDNALWLESIDALHKLLLSASASWIVGLSILMFVTCGLMFLLPFGRHRLGGEEAQKSFSRLQCFAISFCTSIATGIIYWIHGEPFLHLNSFPFAEYGVSQPSEKIAASVAILWQHWSVVVYSIYAIPTVLVSYLVHTRGFPLSISSIFFLFSWPRLAERTRPWFDALCIFTMVCGVAASLATGIMMLTGSLNDLFALPKDAYGYGVVGFTISICFIASSISGVMRGIKWLSYLNLALMLSIAYLFLQRESEILSLSHFLRSLDFFGVHLQGLGAHAMHFTLSAWSKDWTVFYWSSWIAWAPLTSMFFSKLTRGYQVREVVFTYFVLPSLLTLLWIYLVSNLVMELDLQLGGSLAVLSLKEGPEAILSAALKHFPYSPAVTALVLLSSFVCFVTTADSNATVMSDLSLREQHRGDKDSRMSHGLKVFWGMMIAFLSWSMLSFFGLNGLRILNNLAAFPALAMLSLMLLALICVIFFQARIWRNFMLVRLFPRKKSEKPSSAPAFLTKK